MRKTTTAENLDMSEANSKQRKKYKNVHGGKTRDDKGNMIKIGTLNVRSINKERGERNVTDIMKQYKIHKVEIQEIKITKE